MDFTELRAKLDELVLQQLDQPESAVGREAAAARLAAIRNATDDLHEVLDDIDGEAEKLLIEHGVDTKRCTKCSNWMVVSSKGRPRVYCSDRCKIEARAARS